MGLGLGYALAGLGQGLDQGIGNYLAQKRYENELAIQQQAAADAHRHALLGDVVEYGYQPPGATPPDDGGVSTPSQRATPQPMVGSLLGQAASGPAANTPTLSPGSVLGAQRTGLSGSDTGLAPAPVTAALTGQGAAPSGRVSVPGVGSIDPTNSMFGIKRSLAIAQMLGEQAKTQHQQLVNAAGPAAIEGTPEYASYMANLEGAKAMAALPAHIREMVTKGQIDYQTGLALAQVHGNIEHGLQNQRFTFEHGQQQNQQQFERGMLPQRTAADVAAGQQKSIFNTSQGVVGRIGQALHLLPTKPTASLPSTSTGAVDPVAQQRADWDAAAAHLGAGQNAAAVLGPRP